MLKSDFQNPEMNAPLMFGNVSNLNLIQTAIMQKVDELLSELNEPIPIDMDPKNPKKECDRNWSFNTTTLAIRLTNDL